MTPSHHGPLESARKGTSEERLLSVLEEETSIDDDGCSKVDWLGSSATDRQLGGWRSSFIIVGATSLAALGYAGIISNLVLYLTRSWRQGNDAAANTVTNLLGTSFLASFLGGLLSDAYLGRLWGALVFLIIECVGCTFVSISATLQTMGDPMTNGLRAFLLASLYLIAIGEGMRLPVFISLGADQLEAPVDKTAFLNLLFLFTTLSQALSLIVLSYLENNGKWALGFWISTAAMGSAALLFLGGAPCFRQHRAAGNPLIRVAQVLVSAFRKQRMKLPQSTKALFEMPGQRSAIPGSRKLRHTNKFRWLDKAAMMTEGNFNNGCHASHKPWRICTVTQVEEVKCVIRILPFALLEVVFNITTSQTSTLFVEQANLMDGHLTHNLELPPASMQLFAILSMAVFAALSLCLSTPWRIRRHHRGQFKALSHLQRIGLGHLCSVLTMLVAGLVEMKRLETTGLNSRKRPEGKGMQLQQQQQQLSVLWLMPQYVLTGIAQICMYVGNMGFFYTQVSDGMRSVGCAMPLICHGLGNYASTLLVSIVTEISSKRGGSWIGKQDLNDGHLDYFYWLLGGLMLLNLSIFLVCSHYYTYLHTIQEEAEEHEEQ